MIRKLPRLFGLAVLGAVVAALIGTFVVYRLSDQRIDRRYALASEDVAIPADASALARGRYLAEAIAKCADCHGEGLGGAIVVDDPGLGRLVAANLTAGMGGVGGTYARGDWVRALRHGVGPGGRPLLFMPSQNYAYMGDADLGALIAYLESLPPRDSALPGNIVGPIGRVSFLAGRLPLLPVELIDHAARAGPSPHPATRQHGAYLADIGGCIGCHGPGLSGGPIPGGDPASPPAANLTPDRPTGLGDWIAADFEIALRAGTRPDGSAIDAAMPRQSAAKMTGEDMQALWLYLQSVPPKPAGGR